MRCAECGKAAPTRCILLGRSTGAIWVSWWEARADDLCEPCLENRYEAWTCRTALLGWWGWRAAFETIRVLPGNIVERRRARRTEPIPAEPSEAQVLAAAALREQLWRMRGASNWIWYGGVVLLLGLALVQFLWDVEGDDGVRRNLVRAFSLACIVGGGGAVVTGIERRKAIASMSVAELLRPAGAAPPRV